MTARKYSNMVGLKKNMKNISDKVLKIDADFVGIIDGIEGSGKSTLALHLGTFIHEATPELPPFSADNIIFTFEEFAEKIQSSAKYSCLVIDESINFGFSREGMRGENIKTMKLLFQSRSKNLALFFLIPDIFSADRIIRDWRAGTRFHLPERGKVMVHVKKRSIYKKETFWHLVLLDSFSEVTGNLWTEYLKKKTKAFKELKAHDDISGKLTSSERRKFNAILKRKNKTQIERAEILSVSKATIQNDDKYYKSLELE